MPSSLTCRAPDPDRGEDLAPWTFPAYRHLLDFEPVELNPRYGDRRRVRPVASMAEEGGAGVMGLALGCLPVEEEMDRRPAELLSIFVHPQRRNQGIGGRLLDHLEGRVREAGARRMEAVYMTGEDSIEYVERLLASRAWSDPEMRMAVVRFTVEQAKSTPWFGRYRRREQMGFFPWVEITDQEMEALRESHRASEWIAEDLVPWQFDLEGVEPHSSLGIRVEDEVVGWVINHLMPDRTVRFTCSFIHPRLKRRGRIVPAYTESIRRLDEAGFERCMFTAPAYHPEMVQFVKRWCGPWGSFLGETRGSSKVLRE